MGHPHRDGLRFGSLLAATLVALGCATPQGRARPSRASTDRAPTSARSPRSLTDRPDDVPGAYQIHVVYAVPADGIDRGLDTSGTIAGSVASWNGWLARQTGGQRQRIDTFDGVTDVTFVRLRRTGADLAARGAFLREAIEAELPEAGLPLLPNKLYAVYYDGASAHSCGGGAYPPRISGHVAAMYLRGTPPGAPPCESNAFRPADAAPGYLEYAMLHEILHTEGFVAKGSPNEHSAGHVFDAHAPAPERDLMYARRSPQDPPWATNREGGLVLDINHDDYFAHGDAALPDLRLSVFMDPTAPGAYLPRGFR